MLAEGKASQLTLRKVARRAGVSHGAPYKCFSDRASLMDKIALIGLKQLGNDLAKATGLCAWHRRRPPALAAVARAYLAFGLANPAIYV